MAQRLRSKWQVHDPAKWEQWDALGLLMDELPGLAMLHVEVGDDGRVIACEYKVRSVCHGTVKW